jgi:hypothetical protein
MKTPITLISSAGDRERDFEGTVGERSPEGDDYGTWNSFMDAGRTAADYHPAGHIQPLKRV